MTILEYYIEKQKDSNWYKNFQSIGDKYHGKTFDFINTNFRKLNSFCSQLDIFRIQDGKKRDEWSTMDCGQETDKHRIVNLKNAGLITCNNNRYYITDKGHEILRINDSEELNDREKWLLVLMLLSDYKTDKRDMDVIYTAINLAETLSSHGVRRQDLITLLSSARSVADKNELFKNDVFWLITFYTDKDFVDLYLQSSDDEKKKLYMHVIVCSRNKDSKDCIAHKFVSSGAYSARTFNEDINVLLCVLVIAALEGDSWGPFLKLITRLYVSTNSNNIINFMNDKKTMYDEVYKNTYLKLFNK